MFTFSIWFVTLGLELLLLLRALGTGFFQKYMFFYIYVTWVFVLSVARLVVYLNEPGSYSDFYWYTQLPSVFVGCGVIWEIYRQALGQYPGAARMARNVLLFAMLMVLSRVVVHAWSVPAWWRSGMTAEVERNLRTVQAVFLIALVLILAHYAIPLGRNLKGMILGYGFFISTSVVDLTFRIFLGDPFLKWWLYLQPFCYLLVLSVWCWTLWSYHAQPALRTEAKIEDDYQLLAARTKRRLLHARTYLGRAMRP